MKAASVLLQAACNCRRNEENSTEARNYEPRIQDLQLCVHNSMDPLLPLK